MTSTPFRSSPAHRPGVRAPERFSDPPISLDTAAAMMRDFGFVAFRFPPGAALPGSCLMVALQATPTYRHFDPEIAGFWVNDGVHGSLASVTADDAMPVSRAFSWGTIRLADRFGAQNSFVTFGGVLHAERIGDGSSLLVFRSSAAILRLPGHSQFPDQVAEEVASFFRRIVPRLWTPPDMERRLCEAGPDALYGAFLLQAHDRLGSSRQLRESRPEEVDAVRAELDALTIHRPHAVADGRRLLHALGMTTGRTIR